MKPDALSVDSLGFGAWADNLITNTLENLHGQPLRDFVIDENDVMVSMITDGTTANFIVRAYVPGKGWLLHDRVVYLKTGRQL
jgi:hypothetical protein